jgi:hypothetical protein
MGKKIIQFVPFIVTALILTLAVPAPNLAQDKKLNDEIKSLTSRIEALEKQIKEQDIKIEKLNNELEQFHSSMFAIPKIPNSNDLPKGSKPFQFNGQTYYMVPIKSTMDTK